MEHFVHDANISCLRCQMLKPGSGGMPLDSQNNGLVDIIACNVKRRNYLAYLYTHTYYHIIALAPKLLSLCPAQEALLLLFEALSQFVVQGSGTCSAATRFGNMIFNCA
jgi:hypothetical protein